MKVSSFLQKTFGEHLPDDLPPLALDQGGRDQGTVASPYARHGAQLTTILSSAGRDDLIRLMQALDWQIPLAGATAPGFAENTMYVQFYGPETHGDLPDFRVGLFYMAPDLFYPAHRHAAREVYVRLAGACDFTLGPDQDQLETGPFLINEPEHIHAMRAGPQGALFAWLWTGDVDWGSYSYV